jgi:hypothetical protein
MKYCELEIDLQHKMQNATYRDSKEIKNIVNRTLKKADNCIDFKMELCNQIGILLDDVRNILKDIFDKENLKLQPEKENQIPPKE